jgi:hypothetical protein
MSGAGNHPHDGRLAFCKLAQDKKGRCGLVLIKEPKESLDVLVFPRSKPLPSINVPIDEALVPVFNIK